MLHTYIQVAVVSQTLLQEAHVLPKLFSYE
jgi:hypothetical protein